MLPALEAHRPEVVFSLKQSSFPGPAHVPAILDPGVKWFHVAGSGVDHVESHLRPDQRLTSGRGVLAPFIAERAMAGLLHLVTGMDAMRAAAARRRWSPARFRPLAGRRVLVVGAGEAGAARAADQQPFGCRVTGVGQLGVMRPGFDAMHGPRTDALLALDVVALHVPLDERTRGMIDARRLELLPQGALLPTRRAGPSLTRPPSRRPSRVRSRAHGSTSSRWSRCRRAGALWLHPRVIVSPHHADQAQDFPARFAEHFLELAREQRGDALHPARGGCVECSRGRRPCRPLTPRNHDDHVHDFTLPAIDGLDRSREDLEGGGPRGQRRLQVRIDPAYEGLQRLHEEYGARGLAVLGFPCNQFKGQEPGTEAEIQTFCSSTYGVTFPLFAKVEVNGRGRHPLRLS